MLVLTLTIEAPTEQDLTDLFTWTKEDVFDFGMRRRNHSGESGKVLFIITGMEEDVRKTILQ